MKKLTFLFFVALIVPNLCALGAEIEIAKDITYLEDVNYPDNKDKLDLYSPAGDGPHPVMIFIHGGGLLQGSKDSYEFVGRYFAENGFVAVVPNYRLSPDVKHPGHIEDIAASFVWVHRNIAKHRGDPSNVFVTGHSAGAYLAGLLALDARYLEFHNLTLENIRGVIPISGFFHVNRIAPERPKTVWGEDPDEWLAASPARYAGTVTAAPPFLFLYADGDVAERRKESEDMAAALRENGHLHVITQEVKDRNHGSIARRLGSEGDVAAAAMLDFMN